ncbi:MAG: type I 3-dehydroquinate dehydratase [Gemmatales bacterium]
MESQLAAEAGAEMIELRLDFLSRAIDLKRLLVDKRCPMLATIRRHEDGGRWTKSEDERQMLMRLAIVGGFDWVDIETDIADKIKRYGKVKRIVSYHNMKELPRNLEEIFEKMHHQDADVLKVAVRIDKPQDNWRVMRLMKHAKKPTVAIAMGDYGLPSRLLGAKYVLPLPTPHSTKNGESLPVCSRSTRCVKFTTTTRSTKKPKYSRLWVIRSCTA